MSEQKVVVLPEMEGLEFDEVHHIYTLDGLIIPSVSNILEPLSAVKYERVDSRTLERAATRGTSVHNGIENWIKFGIEDVPEEHEGYFEAFLKWWNANNPTVIASELRMYHKFLRYGGTCDLLCLIEDKLALIDFKTTYAVSDMTCSVQLEGYGQALATHGVKVDRKLILHLKKDGTYNDKQEYPAQDPTCWRVFGALKCLYDFKESYK